MADCSKCKTDLHEYMNYCWNCGEPHKDGLQRANVQKEPKYETCEILFDKDEKKSGWASPVMQFWAKAIGSYGVYNTGESVYFKGALPPESDNDKALIAHKLLVSKLIRDGWESTGDRGETWYNYRFRREI